MEFELWEPFYKEIRKDFGFSREKDEAVALELDKLLGGNRVPDSSLRKIIRGKEVTVAGNGPNVAEQAGVVIPEPLEETRRSLDVGQEKGQGPPRERTNVGRARFAELLTQVLDLMPSRAASTGGAHVTVELIAPSWTAKPVS